MKAETKHVYLVMEHGNDAPVFVCEDQNWADAMAREHQRMTGKVSWTFKEKLWRKGERV